jgi:hypothetical protein
LPCRRRGNFPPRAGLETLVGCEPVPLRKPRTGHGHETLEEGRRRPARPIVSRRGRQASAH